MVLGGEERKGRLRAGAWSIISLTIKQGSIGPAAAAVIGPTVAVVVVAAWADVRRPGLEDAPKPLVPTARPLSRRVETDPPS